MNMKKLFSLLMALLMVFSMTAAFAEDTKEEDAKAKIVAVPRAVKAYEVVINDPSDAGNRSYAAFQIFSGEVQGNVLTNIEWGSGVDSDQLLAKLAEKFQAFTLTDNAYSVAEKLSEGAVDIVDFADVVGDYCKNEEYTAEKTEDGQAFYFENLPAGYYLIVETTMDTSGLTPDSVSRYIIQVVKDTRVEPKRVAPELDKDIVDVDGSNPVDFNNGALGTSVYYQIKGDVPDMTGYNYYYYVINDVLSAGLTYHHDTLSITIDGEQLTEGEHYAVNSTVLDGEDTTIEIVFLNFKQWQDHRGVDKVVVRYAATINEHAVVGVAGNPNKANLVYSNDPTHNYDNTTDVPTGTDPVGETPDQWTRTYVTDLTIKKIDEDTKLPLTGVTFQIYGQKLFMIENTVEVFAEDANGAYYKLLNGTYTTEAPTEATSALYETDGKKYAKTTTTEVVKIPGSFAAEVAVNESGEIVVSGLSAGVYEITEIVAPAEYGMLRLSQPITLTIGWTAPTGTSTDCTWTYTWSVAGTDSVLVHGNANVLTVENKKGSSLPSTGGAGTTALYIVGGVLVLAAFVMIVSKRRAAAK